MEAEIPHNNQDERQKTEAEIVLGSMPSFEQHMQDDLEKPHRKTFEEKAKEKGYYKNEDGVWMQRFDDGFDEEVEAFKLDEEYPELADKTEALAERYRVNYGDQAGLKEAIYENADTLIDASDAHLDNLFAIAGSIAFLNGDTESILANRDGNELESIRDFIDSYYEMTAQHTPDGKTGRDIMSISEYFVRNYQPKLIEGDFLEKISEHTARALQDSRNGYILVDGIKNGIEGLGKNEGSGRYFGEYIDYANELASDKEKITRFEKKIDVLTRYVGNHGISEKTVSGFRDIIFPLLEQGDAEVAAIMNGGNAYGTNVGEYGIADYTEECLLSTYTPGDIDKLIRIYHEIPTSDYKKFEQNRKDAYILQGTIIGGRDFIHDERIGTNEMLSAMKDYYDNRNSQDAESYKQKIIELEEKYHFKVLPNALDLDAYEKPIEDTRKSHDAADGGPNERPIDILNRLVKNTRPDLLRAPTMKYPDLNELMANINPLINEKTGEVRVDIKEVGAAVKAMNDFLLQNRGKQGIYPSTISAITFLDKMSTYALTNADSKEVQELVFDPNFKEIVRFSQLTSSMEYNETDFENKYRQIAEMVSAAYGEDGVDSSAVAEGYRSLTVNILKNMRALGKNYASKTTTSRFVDAIWSGNLNDQLIGLFERV